MTSLARAHREKMLAAQLAGPALSASAPVAPDIDDGDPASAEYRALLAALHNDLRSLSDVQSVEARGPMKAGMAQTYAAWVDGALMAGAGGAAKQDEIVVTQMIWAIDYRDFPRALDIAEHAIRYGLALPARYERTVGCLVAEDIATIALNEPAAVPREVLDRTAEITAAEDMPDQARAKLSKAIGRAYATAAAAFDPEADNAIAGGKAALLTGALAALRRALELDRKVGVKKDIEQLERRLGELAAPPPAAE